MQRIFRSSFLQSSLHSSAFGLCLAVLFVAPLFGQAAQDAAPASIPSEIFSAKKVFISNGGEESNYWLHKYKWYGDPNQAYSQFYAAMKSWGRYEVVSSPADADLVFEIDYKAEAVAQNPATALARFRLLILEPKTRTKLWAFTSYVEPANRLKTSEKNFGVALSGLVDDMKSVLSSQPTAAQR